MNKRLIVNVLMTVAFVATVFYARTGIFARADVLEGTDDSLVVYAMGRKYEFFYPEIDVGADGPYLKNCEEVVDGIFYDTVKRPTDAYLSVEPSKENPFAITSETNGKCIDKEKLVAAIDDALKRRKGEVTAETVTLYPEITAADLKKETALRSVFTTDYSNSAAERKSNIALACKYIGGEKISPLGVFSFNGKVGERTEERGFSSAKVIENGKFTEGVGGGVCQVSSTVYNAALLAGMTVVERHGHSLAVSYVEPSFDAMVSVGYADLKIKNPTGSNAYIVVDADGKRIRARVYGEKKTETYKRVSVVKEEIAPPEEQVVESAEMTVGETRQMVYGKKGILSAGYLEKYSGGKLVSRILLSSDKYSPMQGIVIKGTAPPAET